MVRRRRRFTEVVIITIVLLLVAWVLVPSPKPGIAYRAICLTNLRQLAVAIDMYADDNTKMYPLAPQWMDATRPYVKSDDEFRCPTISIQKSGPRYGYALNSMIGRTKPMRPQDLPLVFDSTLLNRNACGPITTLPRPGRHHGKSFVVYADGHTTSIAPD